MDGEESPMTLVQLPYPCLLAVLRCCTAEGDLRTVCSSALAHIRLHQAAVEILTSIRAVLKYDQAQRADSLLKYLTTHGQGVSSINLLGKNMGWGGHWSLRQLPHSSLQNLKALQLTWFNLQLQPGPGQWHYARLNGPGVLGALGALPKLTRLDLHNCRLLCCAPGCAGLAAAVAQLTGLQHLSISRVTSAHEAGGPPGFVVPDSALQPLQQLTHLTLVGCRLPKHPGAAWPTSTAWPPGPTGTGLCCLQGLTGLKELKLRLKGNTWTGGQLHGWHDAIQAFMLSELQQLTRLHLGGKFEPGCLAGLTQLRHLTFGAVCRIVPDAPPGALGASDVRPGPTVRRLLSHLQGMQHLTSLAMGHSLNRPAVAPAAAYAALTASTNLHKLDLRHSTLPEGAWEHMFPAGRQMP